MHVPQQLPHIHVTGGVPLVKKNRVVDKPNIVKTYQFGKTTVHIADNYIAKTPEEMEKVDRDVHAALWPIIDEMEQKRSG